MRLRLFALQCAVLSVALYIVGCGEGEVPVPPTDDGQYVNCVCMKLSCFDAAASPPPNYSVLEGGICTTKDYQASAPPFVCSECNATTGQQLAGFKGQQYCVKLNDGDATTRARAACQQFCATASDTAGASFANAVPYFNYLSKWVESGNVQVQQRPVTDIPGWSDPAGVMGYPFGGSYLTRGYDQTGVSCKLTKGAGFEEKAALSSNSSALMLSKSQSSASLTLGDETAQPRAVGFTEVEIDPASGNLVINNIQAAFDDFSLSGIPFQGMVLRSAGPVVAQRVSDGNYVIPQSASFDVHLTLNGNTGTFTGPVQAGSATFDGTQIRLSLQLSLNGTPVSIVLGGALENKPPIAVANVSATVECAGPGGSPVTLDGSGSTDPDGTIVTYVWTDGQQIIYQGSEPTVQVLLPLGSHSLNLTVFDNGGASATTAASVAVVDTTPPQITITDPLLCLWPPNHQLRAFGLADFGVTITDTCDAAPVLVFGEVKIEDDDDDRPEKACDPHAPDIISGTGAVCVRSEKGDRAEARVYTAQVRAIDANCNETVNQVTIRIPHSMHDAVCGKIHRRASCIEENPSEPGAPVFDLDQCTQGAPAPTCEAPVASASPAALTSASKGLTDQPAGCSTGPGALWLSLLGPALLLLRRRHARMG